MQKNNTLLIYAISLLFVFVVQYGFLYYWFLPYILEPFQEAPAAIEHVGDNIIKIYLWLSFWPASFITYLFSTYFKNKIIKDRKSAEINRKWNKEEK